MLSQESNYSLTEADENELDKLCNLLELSGGTTILFAVTPEVSPQHTVVKSLHEYLENTEENFDIHNFFYSENSFHNFLYSLDDNKPEDSETKRKLVMAFGIDQLPTPRLVKEMKQLNLGREELFGRNLVLILWLNKNKFLDEFRQRAPDFWDWREKVVEFETRNPLLYPYLEWLIAENSYLKMSGVMQVNRQVDIFLDQVYVSLQAQWRQHISEISETSTIRINSVSVSQSTGDKLDETVVAQDDLDEIYDYEPLIEDSISVSSNKTVTQRISLSQAVRENSYSVILGAPGAGKTTLLRYLALHFAKTRRDNKEIVIVGEEQEELGKNLLPVFFRIADFAEQLKQQPNLTLLEYLRQFYRQWETHFQQDEEVATEEEVAEFLLLRMRQGQCLMLLDGLDEVFDQKNRKQIVKLINDFVDEFPHNKFVITSRIAGYSDVQLSSRFAEFTIEDMDSEQIERFLYRWCHTVEKAQQPDANEEKWQSKADEQVQDILKSTEDNEGVKRLTTNPLLLTILALIHRNGDRLPNRRVKLYELAVQTLTEDWQLSKKLPDTPKVMLKETEVVELLAPLAYWMHEEKPSGVVTQEEVEQNLALKLAEINDDSPESESVHQAVGEFLRKVRETTGLFVEKTPGLYGFMHLTFEEYFVARYIADNDRSDILQLINNHLHEPRWDEPILLALGYYGVHFPKQVKKLVEKLFNNLEDYQPLLQHGEIRIKNYSSDNPVISYFKEQDEPGNNSQEVEFQLKDLLFAGQVIAEVEVNSVFRKKLISKLVITYLGIDTDEFGNDTTKRLLRLLRKIEQFYQKSEVIDLLKESANDSTLSEEIHIRAKTAVLYVACGDSSRLVDCAIEIVNKLEPSLFCSLKNLFREMGDEMTPALENVREHCNPNEACQDTLDFLTAMSYMRENKYDKCIEIFEVITENSESCFSPYIAWSLALSHQYKEIFDKAIFYYQKCFEKLTKYIQPSKLMTFWRSRGVCHMLDTKYKEALDCFQQMLSISKEISKTHDEALALYYIGRTYQNWDKYEQAINYHQQSLNLCQQLGFDKDVAKQWSWLGNCYQLWGKYEQAINYYQQSKEFYQQLGRDKNIANQWHNQANCYQVWGKYEQSVEYQNQCLAIHQQSDDQLNIAFAYYQLGRIYSDWGKYKQAVDYYQQSKDIHQQLGRDKNVANMWSWLGICYQLWGKHEQAIKYQNQCLTIRQQLDNQTRIAVSYYQLGRIYTDWGKYEQAVNYYQKSKDIYQQLGRDKHIAYQYCWLGNCYRLWGKYKQAVECQNQFVSILQQLDDQASIALAYFQLGRIYSDWGKHQQAINYYQQSKDIYQQLGRDKDTAYQYYWLGNCYSLWSKYEQAVECQNQCLTIREQLDDQVNIAFAYFQLGRIYSDWGKYKQAVDYYQQSKDIHQQLGRDKNVANMWSWLGSCYQLWGKYEQAIECQNQCLTIRQQLDNQADIATTYFQLGRIYTNCGEYQLAVDYYQQSKSIYQQLNLDKNVANLWYWLANCYHLYNEYEQAIECQNRCLTIRQQLDDQASIALAYYQLGIIYKDWGKYQQAIDCHQESKEIYQQLGHDKDVAKIWSWLGNCYRNVKDYKKAIEYYQASLSLHQQLDQEQSIARRYRQLAYSQSLLVKNISNNTEICELLTQAEQNINQAIKIDFEREYKQNLAYDYIVFSLLCSERLRLTPNNLSTQDKISLFEEYYHKALIYFDELGQTIDKAKEALDIARAYLEVEALENLDKSEEIAKESLQIFQDYNRRKLEAKTRKLLGEIYQKRAQKNQPDAESIATQFLSQSLKIYQDLDLQEKALEVEQILYSK